VNDVLDFPLTVQILRNERQAAPASALHIMGDLTAEQCEQKARQCERLARSCTDRAAMKAIKEMADEYTAMAAALRRKTPGSGDAGG